jgi:hypothetical protein
MNKIKEIGPVLGIIIVLLGLLLMLNSAQQIAQPVLDCQDKINVLEDRIDSLTMEVQARDILISKCKDTVYGEEVIP